MRIIAPGGVTEIGHCCIVCECVYCIIVVVLRRRLSSWQACASPLPPEADAIGWLRSSGPHNSRTYLTYTYD